MDHLVHFFHGNRQQGRVAVLPVLRQKVAGQLAAAVRKCVQLLPAAHMKTFVRTGGRDQYQGVAKGMDTASDFQRHFVTFQPFGSARSVSAARSAAPFHWFTGPQRYHPFP